MAVQPNPMLDVSCRLWQTCTAWLAEQAHPGRTPQAKAEVTIRSTSMPFPAGLPADNARLDVMLRTSTQVVSPPGLTIDAQPSAPDDHPLIDDLDVTAAHAVVLVQRAPGFVAQAQVQHQQQPLPIGAWHVRLPGIETGSLRRCLEYIYTQKVTTVDLNIQDKLATHRAAVYLHLPGLVVQFRSHVAGFDALKLALWDDAVALGYTSADQSHSVDGSLELHPTRLLGTRHMSPAVVEHAAALLKASSDAMLVVAGTELPCHSVVLCQYSPVFGAWFDRAWQPKQWVRCLKLSLPADVPLHSVQRMLAFAYSGRLDLGTVPMDELLDLLGMSVPVCRSYPPSSLGLACLQC